MLTAGAAVDKNFAGTFLIEPVTISSDHLPDARSDFTGRAMISQYYMNLNSYWLKLL